MTKTTFLECNSIVFLNHTSVLLIGDESYVSNFYKQRYDSFDPIISAREKCKSLKFVIEDRGLSAEVMLGDSSRDVVDNFEEIEVQSDVFIKVIERTVNLESIYIGFLGKFYRYPIDEYNHDVVHLLNEFGYKYMNSLKV